MNKNLRIKLIDLSKHFRTATFGSCVVLDGLSVVFEQGQTYAVTGVSGSGKSTLLFTMGGLDKPSGGKVLFDEIDIYNIPPEKRQIFLQKSIGIVFQKPYLVKELSVLENCMLKAYGLEKVDHAQDQALELLKMVGLEEKANDSPATLSGGQQQRVALARALFLKPHFLIADEPTAHLDQKTKKIVLDLILRLCEQFNMGLIISTHDQEIACQMNTVYEVGGGKLTIAGGLNIGQRSENLQV